MTFINPLNILETKLPELILGAFSLVAALAWNEYIKDLVKTYLDNSITAKLWYAIISTLILIAAITIISIIMSWFKMSKQKVMNIVNNQNFV